MSMLENKAHPGKCVHVGSGYYLYLRECNASEEWQFFYFSDPGRLYRKGFIFNRGLNNCMATSNYDGTGNLTHEDCDTISASNYWGVYEGGKVINRESRQCIEFNAGGDAYLRYCDDSPE